MSQVVQLPVDFWVRLVSGKWFTFGSLGVVLRINKSIHTAMGNLEALKKLRDLIRSQVSVALNINAQPSPTPNLFGEDLPVLMTALGADGQAMLPPSELLARVDTLMHNSVEFSLLVELCKHFHHRNLVSRSTGGIFQRMRLFDLQFYPSTPCQKVQHLIDFRELFEFLNSNLDYMREILNANGINPVVLVKCIQESSPRLVGTVVQMNIYLMDVLYGKAFTIEVLTKLDLFQWKVVQPTSFSEIEVRSLKRFSIKTLFQSFEENLGRL